jgi:hypothetical protein
MPDKESAMTKKVKKYLGYQGQWYADVTYDDGTKERLPCVHEHFYRWNNGRPYYEDPWASTKRKDTYAVRQNAKFKPHIAMIQEKRRVVLTTDTVDVSKDRAEGYFKRKPKGYRGVWEIDNFKLDEQSMRFDFVERFAR